MNYYFTSDGQRVSKSEVDRKVRKAKEMKISQMINEYGYVFCEECGMNDCKPVDCSHDKSVDWCQKNRCVELAWDINNITMRGRKCHRIKDKTYIGNMPKLEKNNDLFIFGRKTTKK